MLPNKLACSTQDAAALLSDEDSHAELEAAKEVVFLTLDRWSIHTLQDGRKYRLHDKHANFIQERIAHYAETLAGLHDERRRSIILVLGGAG